MADLNREDVFGGTEFLPKLIEELNTVFPPLSPEPAHDISTIMYRSGMRAVVDYLSNKLED